MNVKEAANIETFTEDTTFAVVTAMVHMPNGVQRMNPEIEGLVQTSLNMGILTTEESEVQMTFAVRSSSETEKQYLIDQLTSLTETLGGNVEIAGPYPDGNTKQIPDYVRLWLKHINIYTTEKNQLLKVFMQDLNVESLLLNCGA